MCQRRLGDPLRLSNKVWHVLSRFSWSRSWRKPALSKFVDLSGFFEFDLAFGRPMGGAIIRGALSYVDSRPRMHDFGLRRKIYWYGYSNA